MRAGSNPHKTHGKVVPSVNHRVLVVIYVPSLTGYYQNSLQVLELCIKSLIFANKQNYVITLINNGSCKEVQQLIDKYSAEHIDTIISHKENIGKIDALIGAARGAREDLITLSDADILFRPGWDLAVQKIFLTFKKAGSVSPIPFRHGLFYGTSSLLWDVLVGKLKFSFKPIPENFEDQNKYLSSINWNKEKNDQVKWPVISEKGVEAVVGSGHQVLTLRRDIIFSKVPQTPSLTLIGGDSEKRYIDDPIDKAGLWRVCTRENFAYHMGNQVEPWMEEFSRIPNASEKHNKIYKLEKSDKWNITNKFYEVRKNLIKAMFKLLYPEWKKKS